MLVLMTSDVKADTQIVHVKALETVLDEVTPKVCQKLCSNDCIIAFANI